MHGIELGLLIAGVLLFISIAVSRASGRFGVPALLLFLLVGMLAGSDGPGGIYFNNPEIAQSLGTAALVVILFAGGLDTDWQAIRPVLGQGLLLANIGVLISAGLVGTFAVYVLGFAPLEGLLFGAIISSTDAAAVFSVLRVRGINLKHRLEPLIELESGSNDPIAVFLTIGITTLLTVPDSSIVSLVPSFVLQMALGALCGYGMGRLMTFAVNRMRLIAEGLYPVLTVALMMMTFGGTSAIGGNGFLAIYIAGLVFGNRDFIHKRSLMRFHDGLAWLMQITMFLVLGLLVFPSRLPAVAGVGLLAAAFLIGVARPLSVFGALAFTRRGIAEKLMISWAGLRGAVPIVLATFPLLAGVTQAQVIFDLVFFIVLASVLLQGTTIGLVSRWLKLNAPGDSHKMYPLEFVPSVSMNSQLMEIKVQPGSPAVGRTVMALQLPRGALMVLITRDNEGIVPSGSSVIEANDTLLLLIERDSIPQVQSLFVASPPAPTTITPMVKDS